MPWPTADEPHFADASPPPDCDDCSDRRALDIMARQADQLVEVSKSGHADTQAEIRHLGDRLSADLTLYARLLLVALGVVAALSGIRMVLPDGTTITPTAEAAEATASADAE